MASNTFTFRFSKSGTKAKVTAFAALALAGCGRNKENSLEYRESPVCLTSCVVPPVEKPSDESKTQSGNDQAMLQLIALEKPQTCDEAKAKLEGLLVETVQAEANRLIRNFDAMGGAYRSAVGTAPAEGVSNSVAPASAKANDSAPAEYTTTNNQVEGVEEGDFVKNTATHMFLVRRNKLHILKSWPAADMRLISTLELAKDQVNEMVFADGGKLVIAATPQGQNLPPNIIPLGAPDEARFAPDMIGYYHQQNTTSLTVIDISQLDSPKVLDRKLVLGDYKTFRRIGNSVRMVLTTPLQSPGSELWSVQWSTNDGKPRSKAEFARELNTKLEEQKSKIRGQSFSDLVKLLVTGGSQPQLWPDGETNWVDFTRQSAQCNNFSIPRIPGEVLSLSNIVTLNLEEPSTVSQEVVLGHSGIVYASKSSLYLASNSWGWWNNFRESAPAAGTTLDHTILHRFNIADPKASKYEGSGIVAGTALNQFSMDEYNDVLRIATTVTTDSGDQKCGFFGCQTKRVNRLTTLKLDAGVLRVLGQSPDLAEGESIFSARFNGDRGFIVTFRQVDPLFSFDLKDPSNPKVIGELKIPGFSNYMQFIDANNILTVGQDADPATGRTRSLKISLFDVSDMKNLKERSSLVFSQNSWANSEAQYDHKAFTYFKKTGHLAIPVWKYSSGPGYSYENKLELFKVSLDSGIQTAGAINLGDIPVPNQNPQMDYRTPFELNVQRSIFADDFVYAISKGAIRVAPLAKPGSPAATVIFE
jgi:uncharacterized secreted protein with C-terminal beta-propeller domain